MRVALTGSLLLVLFAACPFAAGQTNDVVTLDGIAYSNVVWGTVTPAAITHRTG